MKIAILGGTGFVGQYLVTELLKQADSPSLLVRNATDNRHENSEKITWYAGSLDDTNSLKAMLEGKDAVIYNIGILRAYPAQGITFENLQYKGVVTTAALAQEMGVKRFILMSANGVDLKLTPYQLSKAAAEDHLKQSDLDWTIFRPSVIFGNPLGRTEFASMLKRDIIDPPFPAPLFFEGINPQHAGEFQLSPVHVEDVAKAFIQALHLPETVGKTYTLGGPEDLSWQEILKRIAQVNGKTKVMLPVPAIAPSMAAMLLDRYSWFPISRDQIRMLTKGNTCRGDEIFNLCGIQPKSFSPDHLQYLLNKRSTGEDKTASAY
ncbi:MAG: NAD(P)H-binding protein [Candidatus Thiodiazotropha lotti]|nr:NAD(P)H-binding protein [Candidatus Thiodiazotropha lotti]MCW4219263.1 NAD(P)H-binding protein [Candidatus Thiodiazotropha lotti]